MQGFAKISDSASYFIAKNGDGGTKNSAILGLEKTSTENKIILTQSKYSIMTIAVNFIFLFSNHISFETYLILNTCQGSRSSLSKSIGTSRSILFSCFDIRPKN